jgi:hypothetical protein
LLPIGICVGVAVLLGIAVGAQGGSPDDLVGIGVLMDILTIVALIVMAVKTPAAKQENATQEGAPVQARLVDRREKAA